MTRQSFVFRTRIEAPAAEVFAWHGRPGAFERLAPPWESVEVEKRLGDIQEGGCVVLRAKIGPLSLRWVIRHQDLVEGRQFRDIQLSGPFKAWEHTHLFEPDGPAACWMEDRIEYVLPGGAIGEQLASGYTQKKLQRIFRYRHEIVAQDLALRRRYPAAQPLRIALSGSTGLVGSALVPFLTANGHRVTRLVRSPVEPGEDAIEWQPAADRLDAAALEGVDAVIHLAGENIASRWTPEKKERIHESRGKATRLLSEALARLERPPRVLIAASAVGIYGNRGGEELTEESAAGKGFLADVCREWEAASEPAAARGIRVLNLRLGMILSPQGGALAKMLPPFELGLGGRVGNGEQYVSWIAIDDVIGVVDHALATNALSGPVNVAAPQAVKNWKFAQTLGKVLSRPTFLSMPAAALTTIFGSMAEEVLLASAHAVPQRLTATGYQFFYPELASALRHLLGRYERTGSSDQ